MGPDHEEQIERFMKEVDAYAALWAAKHVGLLPAKEADHARLQKRDKLKKILRNEFKKKEKTT